MKRFLYVLMAVFVFALVPGCGSDKEKGMNRPDKKRDLPRAAPTDEGK